MKHYPCQAARVRKREDRDQVVGVVKVSTVDDLAERQGIDEFGSYRPTTNSRAASGAPDWNSHVPNPNPGTESADSVKLLKHRDPTTLPRTGGVLAQIAEMLPPVSANQVLHQTRWIRIPHHATTRIETSPPLELRLKQRQS